MGCTSSPGTLAVFNNKCRYDECWRSILPASFTLDFSSLTIAVTKEPAYTSPSNQPRRGVSRIGSFYRSYILSIAGSCRAKPSNGNKYMNIVDKTSRDLKFGHCNQIFPSSEPVISEAKIVQRQIYISSAFKFLQDVFSFLGMPRHGHN